MPRKALSDLKNRLRGVLSGSTLSEVFEHLTRIDAPSDGMELAQRTLDAIGDAIVGTNLLGEVTYLNGVAESLLGWPLAEAMGRPITEVMRMVDAASREEIANPLLLAMTQNKPGDLAPNAVLLRRDGRETAIEDRAAPIRNHEGTAIGGVLVLHDVTTARTLALKQSYSIQYDALTDLPTRILLNDRLRQAMSRALRGRQKLALLYLDLDHFKEINDSLGHAFGDGLLKSVAGRLIGCVRGSDTVCRRGGDEFVVLLAEVAHAQDAGQTADKIIAALNEPHRVDGHDLRVTASIGIGIYPDDGLDAETLMRHADLAMYAAKADGGNGYRFFKPAMNTRAAERQLIESGLRDAILRGEFKLAYQPKVNLATGAIVGVEALIRWDSPDRGMMRPATFLSIAKDSGLIAPIGRWAVSEACRQTRAWQDAGLPPIRMSVNISAEDLRTEGFVTSVGDSLRDTGLPPSTLELELGEDFLMGDADSAETVNRQLKELGVQLALDDFGNGHSSLGQLKRFRIDTLKIGRSFVRDVTTNLDDASIVKAVIHMGRSLNLRVVAQGIETREQFAFLREQGCPDGQGHYFCKAVPGERLTKVLQRGIPSTAPPRSQRANAH